MDKLINADKLFHNIEKDMYNNPYIDQIYRSMHNYQHHCFLYEIDKQPEIDPVQFAGGCYCKECIYHEIEYYPDGKWEVCNDKEFWCNLHDITMPLDGFCSEGKNKNNLKEE